MAASSPFVTSNSLTSWQAHDQSTVNFDYLSASLTWVMNGRMHCEVIGSASCNSSRTNICTLGSGVGFLMGRGNRVECSSTTSLIMATVDVREVSQRRHLWPTSVQMSGRAGYKNQMGLIRNLYTSRPRSRRKLNGRCNRLEIVIVSA